MKLHPYQSAFLCLALFAAGLLLALMLLHGVEQAPGSTPFETPF
jgi:hypothetical protein